MNINSARKCTLLANRILLINGLTLPAEEFSSLLEQLAQVLLKIPEDIIDSNLKKICE